LIYLALILALLTSAVAIVGSVRTQITKLQPLDAHDIAGFASWITSREPTVDRMPPNAERDR